MKKLITALTIGFVSLVFITGCKPKVEETLSVSQGDFVTIEYSSTNMNGETIEDSTQVSYIVGKGSAIKALNTEIIDMKVGETKTIEVSAEDGYGAFHNPNKIQEISNTIFETIGVTPVVGNDFQLGEDLKGTILAVSPVTTTIDFNEKYTLEPAIFNIKILDIQRNDIEQN